VDRVQASMRAFSVGSCQSGTRTAHLRFFEGTSPVKPTHLPVNGYKTRRGGKV